MAKQTFTTGQVLTAAQMTSLQQTAMLGGEASAKTASYTLVAADAGTAISMSNASATTITVNTGLFAAGDTVQITNLGAGVCTITAGTATVNTAASLALAQYESGTLDFTSSSAAIFIKGAGGAAGGGGKVLQVVSTTYTTATSVTGKTFASTGLTLAITPSLATSKVLILVQLEINNARNSADSSGCAIRLKRGSTVINSPYNASSTSKSLDYFISGSTGTRVLASILPMTYLDSPATTSSTTYTVEMANEDASGVSTAQDGSAMSTITLLEIGA